MIFFKSAFLSHNDETQFNAILRTVRYPPWQMIAKRLLQVKSKVFEKLLLTRLEWIISVLVSIFSICRREKKSMFLYISLLHFSIIRHDRVRWISITIYIKFKGAIFRRKMSEKLEKAQQLHSHPLFWFVGRKLSKIVLTINYWLTVLNIFPFLRISVIFLRS